MAEMVGISSTYVSKIENERLDFGDYPSREVILLAGWQLARIEKLFLG